VLVVVAVDVFLYDQAIIGLQQAYEHIYVVALGVEMIDEYVASRGLCGIVP
jgi:hypothetical protein